MDFRDPFKDLTFDGRPGQYREFRRKVILSVAALEDKNQHLAGPKLLSRLSGEAWRCTEHLSVAELRSDKGWLLVLDTLDKHYRHLPEVELHESIDEFLFHLKKRPAEGTTAFSARFKTALSRLENLIQQEREAAHAKRRKRGDSKRRLEPASPVAIPWKILMICHAGNLKVLNIPMTPMRMSSLLLKLNLKCLSHHQPRPKPQVPNLRSLSRRQCHDVPLLLHLNLQVVEIQFAVR